MLTVSILEDSDILLASDWCRPLQLQAMSGDLSDSYTFQNAYSGAPENNVRWARVDRIFGSIWIGKPLRGVISAMAKLGLRYEFLRGELPELHTLQVPKKAQHHSLKRRLELLKKHHERTS